MSLNPTDPGVNAAVFASAGSGKTYQLVTRLVRLLLAGARPDGILAVTFTRKAAGEMQERLLARVRDWAGMDDDRLAAALGGIGEATDLATRRRARHLYEQLLHAERGVRTTTFHALCQELLRRFPLEADVPPGFELAETTGELRDAAFEAMIADATRDPETAVARGLEVLFDALNGIDNTRGALESFLAYRADWWAYTETAADPLAFADARLREFLQVDPHADPVAELLDASSLQRLVEFRGLLEKHVNKGNQEAIERIATVLHEERSRTDRYAALQLVFLTTQGKPRARKPSGAQEKAMGAAGQDRFLALHAEFCADLARCREALARQQALAVNLAWYRAGQCYLDHYQRIKRERRMLDFADLEWRAYRLLNHSDNAAWVQYKLDQRIDHLLIDEFQDTNPTQWRLLLPLLEEIAAGDPERARSVFLVGDPKQSIYGFRRAQPELQAEASHWLEERLAGRQVPLSKSWRSSPAVMVFVNRLFDATPLGAQLSGFQTHDTHHHDLWGRVEVLPLVPKRDRPGPADPEAPPVLRNPLEQPRPVYEDDTAYREGQAIARRIRALIDSGLPVGHGTQARPLRLDDILILLRNRTASAQLERALREAGIPYLGSERGGLLEALEIQDLLALLELLVTPFDNLRLAQVLKSPLFAASDDDLIALASTEGRYWLDRLARLAEDPGASPAIRAAQTRLSAWQPLAGALPIHDLLDHIYTEGDVLARYRAATPEDQRPVVMANLSRFLELALEVDAGRYPSLIKFLDRLRQLRAGANEAPDTPPAQGVDARVRILTVHGSKGLEAPVVILADSTATANGRSTYAALVDWPADAERPARFLLPGRKDDLPEPVRALLDEKQLRDAREDANLLYVALTRARQLLIVSGHARGKGGEDHWYAAIEQAIDGLGARDDEGTWVLEHGEPPTPAAPAATPESPPVPSGLDRRLATPPTTAEIAPSLQVGTGGLVEAEDEDGLARGVAIHRALELLTGPTPPDAHTLAARIAAELALAARREELAVWIGEAQAALDHPAFADVFRPAAGIEARNELPILYARDGRRVYGLIDRLLIGDDRVVVVDYKTHRVDAGQCDALAAHYAPQLRLYADGLRRLWPEKAIDARLLFTHAGRQVRVDLEGA